MNSKDLHSLQEAYLEVYQEEVKKPDPFGRPGGKYGGVPTKGSSYDKAWKAIKKANEKLDVKKLRNEEVGNVSEERDSSHPHWETNRQFKKSQRKNEESKKEEQERATLRKLHQNITFFGNSPTNRLSGKLSKTERTQKEEYELYDRLLAHLLNKGYVETLEAAEVIIENMSDEWLEEIIEGYQQLPVEKINNKLKTKENKAKRLFSKVGKGKDTIKSSFGQPFTVTSSGWNLSLADPKLPEYEEKLKADVKRLKKTSSEIKKMKTTSRNHDSLDSRFKSLENRA